MGNDPTQAPRLFTPGFYWVPPGTKATPCPKCNRKVYEGRGGRRLHAKSAKVVDGHTVAGEHYRCCPGRKSGCPDPNAPSEVGEWFMTRVRGTGSPTKIRPCRRCGKDVAATLRGAALLDMERLEDWGTLPSGARHEMAPPHYLFCKGANNDK